MSRDSGHARSKARAGAAGPRLWGGTRAEAPWRRAQRFLRIRFHRETEDSQQPLKNKTRGVFCELRNSCWSILPTAQRDGRGFPHSRDSQGTDGVSPSPGAVLCTAMSPDHKDDEVASVSLAQFKLGWRGGGLQADRQRPPCHQTWRKWRTLNLPEPAPRPLQPTAKLRLTGQDRR